ncbi:MAG: hypothetical protein Phyf2KO_23460 [Phycisphaerales bacterium]
MRTKAVTVSLLFVAIAAYFAIRSCSKDEPVGIVDPRVGQSDTSTVKPVTGRVHLSKPETLEGHDTVLVAMTIEDVQKRKYHDSFTESEFRTEAATLADRVTPDATREIQHWRFTSVRWHNALFRDLASEECWQLVNQRGVISKFGRLQRITISTETQRKVDSEPVSLLAFFVTLSDTNGDERLTELDSRVCIVTDGDGRNPRTITPADAHVVSASFDREHGLIWLQVAHDTNDDGAFTGLDDVAPMMFDPLSDPEAKPVINAELIKQATDLLKVD